MMRGRSKTLLKAAFAVVIGAAAGCQQKMADQPSFRPDAPSALFHDGSSSRHPAPGTVARGHLHTDAPLFTGRRQLAVPALAPLGAQTRPSAQGASAGDLQTLLAAEAKSYQDLVDEFPYPVTEDVVEQGYNRFMIYCVVCHDPAGTGHGKIVERGYTVPPSYHIDRLRTAPVGHLFQVITEGYGSMPSYASQISARDRWAIVAYIRALQLSQHFPTDKLTPEMLQQLSASARKNAPNSVVEESSP